MYNKEFFEKVVNVDCSFKELKSFCANIDKEKYDTDNASDLYRKKRKSAGNVTKITGGNIRISLWRTKTTRAR